ncbi:MAG: glycoside hydrolase family 19 protein [Flavobacterium sp.]
MIKESLEISKKYETLLKKYGINTPLRKAHFFGQLWHESKLTPISENLNYSSEGLAKVFGKYFPTKELANQYAGQPEKIANRVYANRMGNGSEESGDGWKYRGRGFIQITGKSNYTALTTDTGINFIDHPEKMLSESDALLSALWFWKRRNLNKYADLDDCRSITKLINGGVNGYDDRLSNVKILKSKL